MGVKKEVKAKTDIKVKKQTKLKITADVLYETKHGVKRPKPSHTPEELAALKANNDPRLTRSGVVIVPPDPDRRGGTPFPPRAAYDGSHRHDKDDEDEK
jgi:hypothetical protein